jgi:hypothetical protein
MTKQEVIDRYMKDFDTSESIPFMLLGAIQNWLKRYTGGEFAYTANPKIGILEVRCIAPTEGGIVISVYDTAFHIGETQYDN